MNKLFDSLFKGQKINKEDSLRDVLLEGFIYFKCRKNHTPPCGHFEIDEEADGRERGFSGCSICKWRLDPAITFTSLRYKPKDELIFDGIFSPFD